eukprot:1876_1
MGNWCYCKRHAEPLNLLNPVPSNSLHNQTVQSPQCTTKEEQLTHKNDYIPKKIHTHQMIEIAIFGSSRSGKTSLLNQIHQNFSSQKLLSRAIHDIRQNCVDNISILCEMIDDDQTVQILCDLDIENPHDLPNIAGTIRTIWKQCSIKMKYKYRHFYGNDYLLNDNMDYFLNNIDQIMDINYHPSADDIIRHKSTNPSTTSITKSIQSKSDTCSNHSFTLSDAGTIAGFCQLYNKQWHVFDKAKCVIYMVDLSGYCVQDQWFDSNALRESLRLFNRLLDSRYFKHSMIIVLLNKHDIFKQCIKNGIALNVCFPKYNGPQYLNLLPLLASFIPVQMKKDTGWGLIAPDIQHLVESYLHTKTNEEYFKLCHDEALQYIKQQFVNMHSREVLRRELLEHHYCQHIYYHVCSVMDTQNVNKIFDDIQSRSICMRSLSILINNRSKYRHFGDK